MKTNNEMRNAECGMRSAEISRQWLTAGDAPPLRAPRAFTLIELLVVISVIALLAALTFPALRAAKLSMLRARAKSEMTQIETAIERYKDKFGHYPPDNRISANPDPYALNQLYYELLGTTNVGTPAAPIAATLDGSAQIARDSLPSVFGANVSGFLNCARTGGDEAVNAISFLRGLKPGQFLAITNGTSETPICSVLGANLDGPLIYKNAVGAKLNPWRYNSSSPTNNPNTFDLWIDVAAGGKTNRICNWSDRPLVVSTPYW